jgi:hypothetical protein
MKVERLSEGPFSFLPERTRTFLLGYEYKGLRPSEIDASDVSPGVVFLTADLKVPDVGRAKILELNGTGSRLESYPAGENTAVANIFRTLQSLDMPVHVVTPEPGELESGEKSILNAFGFDAEVGLPITLLGQDVAAGERHGVNYTSDNTPFAPSPEGPQQLQDLQTAEGVVWIQSLGEIPVDEGRFVAVNPQAVEALSRDKLQQRNKFRQRGLDHLRPRSWVLERDDVIQSAADIQADAEGIDRLILKPLDMSGGIGVVPIERDKLRERIKQIFVDPFDESFVEAWLRDEPTEFLVEEYVASKPVERDGKQYDGTMRIAFMAMSNQGKMTVVPIAGYWKLPLEPMGQEFKPESTISTIYQDQPSAEVSPEDLAKGFASVVEAMPLLLRRD